MTEPEVKKQELREKIAKRIADSRCEVCNDCGASISTDNPDEVANQILALIKEAGYTKVVKEPAGNFWEDLKK